MEQQCRVIKRKAEDMSSSDASTPEPKKPRLANGVLAKLETSSGPISRDGKEHVLVAKLEVRKDCLKRACVKRIDATFYLQVSEKAKKKKIGMLYGQTIDRQVKDADRPTETLFVSEMLNKDQATEVGDRPMRHGGAEEKTDETEIIMQHLFRREGTSREEYLHRSFAEETKLHFITHFELYSDYRGCGLAREAMQSYLRGIQKLENGHKFRGTVLLSPAALDQREDFNAVVYPSKPIKTLIEIEAKLIASYEKAGFKVWSKGDDELGGFGTTIMGQIITGPKFREVRTQPVEEAKEDTTAHVSIMPVKRVDSGYRSG